jgi:hypothetical protein
MISWDSLLQTEYTALRFCKREAPPSFIMYFVLISPANGLLAETYSDLL